MRHLPARSGVAFAGALAIVLAGCSSSQDDSSDTQGTGDGSTYTTREVDDGTTTFTVVENPNGGATLSYGPDAGFKVLEEKDGEFTYAFKDMNANGTLDKWEDWRLSGEERAADLVQHLSIEQIEGLMLFSSHERAPEDGLTDAQKQYLSESHLRNVLNAAGNEIEPNVEVQSVGMVTE